MYPVKTSLSQDAKAERRVWSLMAKDFYWSCDALSKLRVGVSAPTRAKLEKEVKLQPFEVIMAAVLAQIRPDYDWWVTPNRPDGGVDFIGRGALLTSKELGIDAAITIGGQCKKRDKVNDVVGELSGSFVRMAEALHPTLFVAAFSAVLTAKRTADAKKKLEAVLQRNCHILDRRQLESLIGSNLSAAKPILRRAFSPEDAAFVIDYFQQRSCSQKPALTVRVSAPSSVLAGESFRLRLQISRSSLSGTSFRLHWSPAAEQNSTGMLVAPLGADTRNGLPLNFDITGGEDPFTLEQDLEFLLYAVGSQPLGTITVHARTGPSKLAITKQLPNVDVVENLRPPFYDVPYREPLDELERGLARARSYRVTCVAVVGAGGAGKTRLCEEVCLESRRHGAYVVSARQAHSTESPRRILANLLLGLTENISQNQTPIDRVDGIISRLEPKLAAKARPAVEALFGQAGKLGTLEDDQSLLSLLVVLIAQRSRSHVVVIHLHDLHWCTFDVLETIDRLIWQLDNLHSQVSSDLPASGLRVLFILEGRMHEHREDVDTGWSTRVFERFIGRLSCPIARCRAFDRHESAAFTRRLFEQEHSASRLLPRTFLGLQQELIDTVHQVAGGSPLHLLEQVKLLQQHEILAQNPKTGLIYMIRPDFRHVPLPVTVFDTIEARWRYYYITNRPLAVLLWAAALVDDNLPAALFRYLWSQLAPSVTQPGLEATEFINFPQRNEDDRQVSFRHENYFQTVRRIQLPDADRRAVVSAYSDWFRKAKALSPVLRYVQAKVELEAPSPNLRRTNKILRTALAGALKNQDGSLASRILATLLDAIIWPSERQKGLSLASLILACDDEVILCRDLVRSGRTDVALERINHALGIIDRCSNSVDGIENFNDLKRRKFVLLTMKARILYHDRQPMEALAITEGAVNELRRLIEGVTASERQEWDTLFMEVQNTHSVAVALIGDMRRAVVEARRAADIAESLLDKSPQALEVIITYANILMCEAPEESEITLQRYQSFAEGPCVSDETKLRLNLNLSMARLLLGYESLTLNEEKGNNLLTTARDALLVVFKRAYPLGRWANAAAAALLLGLISAIWGKSDEIDLFTQASALAARARQLETLWRANINLANSLFRSGQSAHDPAAAALEIMTYSLSAFPEPDRNYRFDLLAVPMAHAIRYLILERDDRATKILRKFPALRRMFNDLQAGQLTEDRDGRTSHEWLRIGSADYVIY
jgi:hypothetical protein